MRSVIAARPCCLWATPAPSAQLATPVFCAFAHAHAPAVANQTALPLVIGGETCMWGETADGADVLQTIWPRAAAAAERQWSYNAAGGSASSPGVVDRLQAFRCLMLERGIPAAPVTNPTARDAPTGPGSCTTQ
jgi:hexosaminidase